MREVLISAPDCRLWVMVGRAGLERGKLMTMIGLVTVANNKNNWDQRMVTHDG